MNQGEGRCTNRTTTISLSLVKQTTVGLDIPLAATNHAYIGQGLEIVYK